MWKPQSTPSPIVEYLVAVLLAVVALLLTSFFRPFITDTMFIFFMAAVTLSAWYGGFRPGLVTGLISLVLADYFLLVPRYEIVANSADVIQISISAFVAFLISWLERQRRQAASALQEARDELRIILEGGIKAGIIAQDGNGRTVFANAAAAEFTDYLSPHSQASFDLFDDNGMPLSRDALPHHRLFVRGERQSLYYRIRSRDNGIERWIQMRSTPVLDEKGSVKLAVNILGDVSERVKDEEERAELASIVDNTDDAIMRENFDGVIINWNPGAERLYGYRASEIVGKHVSILFPEDIMEREMQIQQRIRRGEHIHAYETTRRRKDGKPVEVSMTISPLHNHLGDVIGFSTIERDISHLRRLEKLREENARFLRNVLNSLPIMVGVMTPDGILIETNDTALNMAGLDSSTVLRQSVEQAYWWAYSPEAQQQLKDAVELARSGEVVRYDAKLRAADDQFLTVDLMISPMRDDEGKLVNLILSGLDITDRRRREEEILRLTVLTAMQRRRFENIIANVPGIVYEASGQGESQNHRMDFVSDYAEKMLGYPMERWSSTASLWDDIMHPDDKEPVAAQAREIYQTRQPGVIQFRCFKADGSLLHVETHAAVITDENDEYIGTCGVVMDITRRKEIEDALVQYTEDLRRSNEELERFAYIASHDLQEPLRMVTSYLQLIEQRYGNRLDGDAREFFDFAINGATRMKALINDLLTYSRVRRSHEEYETVSMEKVLDQALENLQLAIEENQAVISHDSLPEVTGQEGYLVQLFQNLISNALKFHTDVPPTVHISAKREGGNWVFSVRDNGIGIEPQYLDRIFVIFQRLHARDQYPGTGIGLAICKKIVENHGGRIWVESQPGAGATFFFTIPAKSAQRGRHGGY